jgi:hypothetical protein
MQRFSRHFGVDPTRPVNKLRFPASGRGGPRTGHGGEKGEVRIMAANDMGNGDMAAHVATYGRMIELLKWGAIAAAILVAIVLWLIA